MTTDLAEYVRTAAEAGSFLTALVTVWQTRRGTRVLDWLRIIEQLAQVSIQEVHVALEQYPRVTELFEIALEEAARSESEEKRWYLAQVVSASLRGSDEAALDKLLFYARTLRAVEAPHMRMLTLIASARPTAQVVATGGWTRPELVEAWPQCESVLMPLIQLLEREGLIENVGIGSYDGETMLSLSAYGRDFLQFVSGEHWSPPPTQGSHRKDGPDEQLSRLSASALTARERMILEAVLAAEREGQDPHASARAVWMGTATEFISTIALMADSALIDAAILRGDNRLLDARIRRVLPLGRAAIGETHPDVENPGD